MVASKPPFNDYIERTPRPEPRNGEEQVTFRLSGFYLERFQEFTKTSGETSKSVIIREALSLLFACASTDAQGNPVEVIIRRKNHNGVPLPDEPIQEFLELISLSTYLKNRKQITE